MALGDYTYRKTVRLEEVGPDGKPAGRAEVVSQVTLEPDGSRRLRTASKPETTLRFTGLEPDALEVIARIPQFFLATTQLPNYNITYQAAEPVDDLSTYVFKVTPRKLDRATAYFSGLVWVDDRDLAIVKTYGKWLTETGEVKLPELPFTLFETYRQLVSNKYWMPAYSRSDGFVVGGDNRVPVRLVIRWENYAPIAAGQTPAAPPAPAPTLGPSR
jgi:hypothetical protein